MSKERRSKYSVEKQVQKLKTIAQEPDDRYLVQSTEMLLKLPGQLKLPALAAEVDNFLDDLRKTPPKIQNQALTFIPVQHFGEAHYGEEGKRFNKEHGRNVYRILQKIHSTPTLVASGEVPLGPFTKNRISNTRKDADRKKLIEMGLFHPDTHSFPNKYTDGYEEAICDFVYHNRDFEALGVDNDSAQTLVTVLRVFMTNFNQDWNSPMSNLIDRLIEGRTRLSLNNAFRLVKPHQSLVFVQGGGHKQGIEQWCQRNSVELRTIVPESLDLKALLT